LILPWEPVIILSGSSPSLADLSVERLRAANAGLPEVIEAQAAHLEAQAARTAELVRQLGSDSSTSCSCSAHVT
jgi:hypothetical protein